MWINIIHPNLDFCPQVWGPPEDPLMDKQERLQKDYLGLCPQTRGLKYDASKSAHFKGDLRDIS